MHSKNKVFQVHLDGMAGVYEVAAQLCRHGHTPYFPGVDSGVDLMTATGIRIQVKTGRLRTNHPAYPHGAYVLDTRKGRTVFQHHIMKHVRDKTYVGVADFVIFFGSDERRFFVVPVREIDGAAWIPPKGFQYQRMGTGRIHKGTGKMGNAARIVSMYEEAWHLLDIDSTLQNLEMADAVAEAERVEK